MTASKELMDKKLSASEFLQRCSYKQKILPNCVIDTTDKYINSMEDDDDSEADQNEIDLNMPSTSSSAASSQTAISQCVCCWAAKPSVLLLRCKHVSSCNTCWSIVKQGFIDRLRIEQGIDFLELEKMAGDDPAFKIPAAQLPKCPYCRAPVDKSITDVYIA